MATRTCRVGVHGRNDARFYDIDYDVIREANVETVKMMSITDRSVFERLKVMKPDTQIITRLYDDRMGSGHPTAAEFAERMVPIIRDLRPYCQMFQVHNEPNHMHLIEGWGPTKEQAQDFNGWFLEVYSRIKGALPDISLGFPGLAVPGFVGHHDEIWLKHCRDAINSADWLGVHCYWQTPPGQPTQAFHPELGLRFKMYHEQYPNKRLEILECGNSNVHNPAYHISDEAIAQEYVDWLKEVFKHPYIGSASFFMLSSPDPQWAFFTWRTEHNHKKPVVPWLGQWHRPELGKVIVDKPPKPPIPKPPTPPKPKPPAPPPEPGEWTNQQSITAFHRAATTLGLPPAKRWSLMSRAGLSLNALARDRGAQYGGPAIAELPRLNDEEKELLLEELGALTRAAAVSFAPGEGPTFLIDRPELLTIALALPPDGRIDLNATNTSTERRVARTWNRYGFLLMEIAVALDIDPDIVVSILAAASDRRGIARNDRLVIRFEPPTFHDRWGVENPIEFAAHFQFDEHRPWQKHHWRLEPGEAWRPCHTDQAEEWAALTCAAALDEDAAGLSTAMGLAGQMGFTYALVGYKSVGQMRDAFSSSERYQVFAFFDLIAGPRAESDAAQALRDRNVETFAALHYGSRQAARQASTIRGLVAAFGALQPLG